MNVYDIKKPSLGTYSNNNPKIDVYLTIDGSYENVRYAYSTNFYKSIKDFVKSWEEENTHLQ